ncbi:hypothetical protein KP509_20G006900 [Ceratopteris richardii]|nr:hypothetical protein KP509_20G006900 [Ceratopteris richardii]
MELLWMDSLHFTPYFDTRSEEMAFRTCHTDETFIYSHNDEFNAFFGAFADNGAPRNCRELYKHTLKHGCSNEMFDYSVSKYVKCGAIGAAKQLLDIYERRNVRSWTAIMVEYIKRRQAQEALDCFHQMQQKGIAADAVAYTCALKACGCIGAIDVGGRIHDEIAKQGLLARNVILGNSLVSMYSKCGALGKAYTVLRNLPIQTTSAWNALIAGYVGKGEGEAALKCIEEMQKKGLTLDVVSYTCALKACGTIGALDKGKEIHDNLNKQGLLGRNVTLDNTLVSMYAKCNALMKARQVLEEIPVRSATSWNALMTGYAQLDHSAEILSCFEQMEHEGVSPNAFTFACVLKACGCVGNAELGERIHKIIAKEGLLEHDVVLGTSLVDMYAKCGDLIKAHCVLEELPVRNVASWNALISGYVTKDKDQQAISCFEKMQRENISPNSLTFSYVLKACGSIGAVDKGAEVHDLMAKQGLLGCDIVLSTALINMYTKFGALRNAQKVFEELPVKDAASWSALIVGYAENGSSEQALACFKKMQKDGHSPDIVTFICILKACGCLRAADEGTKVHERIAEQGFLVDNDVVLGTALLDMYAKCDVLTKARQVFEDLLVRNVVTWNALISGYAEHGDCREALKCFERMQCQGFSPDAVTYLCILKACGSTGAEVWGERFHHEIAKQGHWKNHVVLSTALIDMYVKCGAITKARQVLEELPVRDSVSWNALMIGYVKQGEASHARDCFEQMQCEGLLPDAASFSCMLIACSRLGLVEEAHSHFVNMNMKYGIMPDLEHYTCIIDVFGRAGYLTEALGLIQRMPFCNYNVWSTLLAACQKWGDVKTGKWAFEHAI